MRRIFWVMAVFVIVGTPLIAILWQTLNELLALQVRSSLWFAVPALILFVLLLRLLRRTLEQGDAHASRPTVKDLDHG